MGIHCEINLHKPENGAFIGIAGTVVSGVIKYAVDEEIAFTNITVSLKGIGNLHIVESTSKHQWHYYDKEVYIDIDDVIHNDKEKVVPMGVYDIPFKFVFPQNVPSTLVYKKIGIKYDVKCSIKYYIRIKFNRPGFLNFNKRFKKEITVISGIVPKLSTVPVIYGGQKKLSQLFSHQSIVNIKANILNSVYKCGDKVELIYEVSNNTNMAIKTVETKLVEIHKFFLKQKEVTKNKCDVPESESKTGAIKRGETQEMSVTINLPADKESSEFSKLYSRDYYVHIIVHLPIPHRNFVLEIPIQIGNATTNNNTDAINTNIEVENPPSYWEAMNEDTNDKFDFNEKKATSSTS